MCSLMFDFIDDGKQALVELVHVCVSGVHGLVEGVARWWLLLQLLLERGMGMLHHLLRRRSVFLVKKVCKVVIAVFPRTLGIKLAIVLLRLQCLLLLLDHLLEEAGCVLAGSDSTGSLTQCHLLARILGLA